MFNALVVEDERDIRNLLVLELKGRGYQVQEAQNGEIALQRVRERKPDVIFTDIMMPVMDGNDLIANLRSNSETSGIPLVIVTALSFDKTRGTPRKFGVGYQLKKPWESSALDVVLTKALGPMAQMASVVRQR